jgi:hypothetical protein
MFGRHRAPDRLNRSRWKREVIAMRSNENGHHNERF